MAPPGVTNMREDLKPLFLWKGMKADIVNYMAGCLECQQVKDEHRNPTGLLQTHAIPELKWEVISMDFFVGFPLATMRHDYFFGSRHSNEGWSFYSCAYNVLGT
jgi:hypothetical protein